MTTMTQYFIRSGDKASFAQEVNGKMYTTVECTRCFGKKIIHDARYMQYTAGGHAGGCFKCDATGTETVRAYTEKQMVAITRTKERKAAKRAADHEARAAAWKIEREEIEAEKKIADEIERKRLAPLIVLLTPVADMLTDDKGGFRDSVATEMRRGHAPRGRAIDIVIDIIGKQHGRRNSAAYDDAADDIRTILNQAV